MSPLARVVRDPLVHFLAAGALLFAVFAALHPQAASGASEGKTIVVDREALVAFMQYRSAAFQPQYFEAQFKALSPVERQALIDRYVQEEALVREAGALGLDRGDYVIRRRMIQKMMYLMDDAATGTFAPSDADLQHYFQAHQDAYRGPATVTFTHVFVDNEVSHPEGAQRAAEALKAKLERRRAGFADAPAYGDRFAYLQNYVERTSDFVGSQFGAGFAAALAGLRPSDHWQGPIRSDYGWHLVLLTQRKPAELAKFADVRQQVKEDMLRDTLANYRKKAIADLVGQFRVALKDLPKPAPGQPARPPVEEDGD
ncbi:MAG: peptidyl-prolyl cis-trans isomerase [Caulobacteraceae bacterium]